MAGVIECVAALAPKQFRDVAGLVFRFWFGFGLVLDQRWLVSSSALWPFPPQQIQFRDVAGLALMRFWFGFGSVLDQRWLV